jgi:hypothetical protein
MQNNDFIYLKVDGWVVNVAESVFHYLRKATVFLLAVRHILVHDKIVALLIIYVTLEVVTAATLRLQSSHT